jgi:23S rRNA-intervening sequence protein
MAQYEHLPIYQKAMALVVYIEKTVAGFDRYHRYNIGADLRRLARRNLSLIIRANQAIHERFKVLSQLRDNIEELKVCLRIGKEVRAFRNLNAFLFAIEELFDIARQNQGWLNSTEKKEFVVASPKINIREGNNDDARTMSFA